MVKTTGDGLHAVFETAAAALAAALDAQRQPDAEPGTEIAPDMLRVRMGLHSGEAQLRDGDYYGTAVNRAARIMALGHGGQVLLSAGLAALREELPCRPSTSLRDLGSHPLRGLHGGSISTSWLRPICRVISRRCAPARRLAGNLPARVSSFIGRAREMAEITKRPAADAPADAHRPRRHGQNPPIAAGGR